MSPPPFPGFDRTLPAVPTPPAVWKFEGEQFHTANPVKLGLEKRDDRGMAKIDRVEITWLDGTTRTVVDIEADQRRTVYPNGTIFTIELRAGE